MLSKFKKVKPIVIRRIPFGSSSNPSTQINKIILTEHVLKYYECVHFLRIKDISFDKSEVSNAISALRDAFDMLTVLERELGECGLISSLKTDIKSKIFALARPRKIFAINWE